MAAKSILLVEDNEDDRVVFTAVLQYYGYEVVPATTGEEGVRMAAELHPDLVVMDIRLPGIDGYEAAKLLKANPETKEIPVIVATLFDLDPQRLRESGSDGYLNKPCAPTELQAEVERLIGAAA
jgi:CheY-like chemotaxis protein